MANCYSCGIELKKKLDCSEQELKEYKFSSSEHIIPNFLGGKLKSNELLCDHCNNRLGKEIDSVLSKELPLSRLIDYKRDRGGKHGIVGKSKDGFEFLIKDGRYIVYKPQYVIENNEVVSFLARDEKQARGLLQSIKKEHPLLNLDIDKFMQKIEWIDGPNFIQDTFFGDHSIGSEESFRAIAKIALNIYLYSGGDINTVERLRDFIIGADPNNRFVSFYYPLFNMKFFDYVEGEISNVFYLRADPKWNLLYCYIEFFNVSNFLVVLSDDYHGIEYKWKYKINVLDNKISDDFIINISLLRNPVYWFHEKHASLIQEKLPSELNRVFQLINKIRRDKEGDFPKLK